MTVEINYLAVLIGSAVSMGWGFLYYSPVLVGTLWMKERKITKESINKAQKDMGKYYAISFVLTLLTAYMMSHVMALSNHFFGYPVFMTAITTALSMWVGFIVPVQATATIFGESKNWKLFWIDTMYQLGSLILIGIVLASM